MRLATIKNYFAILMIIFYLIFSL